MLNISRKPKSGKDSISLSLPSDPAELLKLAGQTIDVKLIKMRGKSLSQIGIDAPTGVRILRGELSAKGKAA